MDASELVDASYPSDAAGACTVNADCSSKHCDLVALVCLAPTSNDQIQNGNETDVDCGSSGTGEATNAPACAVDQKCGVDTDCSSPACSYKGVCIAEPSCAHHWGGDTCGTGETGEPGEDHESCCGSIALPTSAGVVAGTRLDKYEITAGRMREFVSRVNGNVYGAYQTWKAAHPTITGSALPVRPQDEQYLPTGNDSPTVASFHNGQPSNLGIYAHLGNQVVYSNVPSGMQGCFVGAPASGSVGEPTYRFSDAVMAQQWSAGPRPNYPNLATDAPIDAATADPLDEKALNCVTEPMLAVFCAWDGGHLATTAEIAAAWGSAPYPWGSTPAITDVPDRTDPNVISVDGGYTVNMALDDGTGHANLLAPQENIANWNWTYPTLPGDLRYYWPELPVASWGSEDVAYEIAAPGRFIHDRRSDPSLTNPGPHDGWFDLGANLIEQTSTTYGATTYDSTSPSVPYFYWIGGSFEGHVPNGSNPNFGENMFTKYGKTGGRCAR